MELCLKVIIPNMGNRDKCCWSVSAAMGHAGSQLTWPLGYPCPLGTVFIFLRERTRAKGLAQDFRSSCMRAWQLWSGQCFSLASPKFMAFFRMTYWEDDWWSVTVVMETGSPVHRVTTINISQPSVGWITDTFRELSDLVLSFTIHGDEFIEWLWLCMNPVREINGH